MASAFAPSAIPALPASRSSRPYTSFSCVSISSGSSRLYRIRSRACTRSRAPSTSPRACATPPTHQPDDLWSSDAARITPLSSVAFPEADVSSGAPPPPGGPTNPDDRGDGDSESRESVLSRYARDDHPDLSSLSSSALADYFEASRSSFVAFLCRVWPGWRRRVAADPDFPFKVLMEETVGLGLAASGMIAARGSAILSELDFAFCDIAVGGALNFILVYLLTPAVGAQAGLGARLPASVFSPGVYGVPARIASFAYKGTLFAGCGFVGSLAGTTLSQGLVLIRRSIGRMRGVDVPAKPLPNVAVNSAAWAGFMFVSSNPRYQTVAGLERVLFGIAPDKVAKLGSGMLRTANNVFGGANWVWWARAIGLQAKPSDPDEFAAD